MQAKSKFGKSSLLSIAMAAGLVSAFPFCLTAQTDETVAHTEEQVREAWRKTMHATAAPREGCFHASYPSTMWQEVECAPAPGYRSVPPKIKNREQTAGNGYDYVAQAPSGHLFTSAVGSFPSVTGVESEKGVGVAALGGGGTLGRNEYSLQVNTNFYYRSSACGEYANCFAWQQFVMATNTPVSITSNQLTNETEVFIEYWLLNYGIDNGSNICPSGFVDGGPDSDGPGDDCVQNTPATVIAKGQLSIIDIEKIKLSGSAVPDGTDAATVTFGNDAYTATVADHYTDIASGWTEAEFNVLGNAGGSRADFNSGSSLTLKLAVTDGSSAAPTCVSPSIYAGTAAETNNLTLGKCTATSATTPYIEFTESN